MSGRRAPGPDQLSFDLEPTEEEIAAELLPGAVVKIVDMLGKEGWQTYRLDWIADEPDPVHGPAVSLTALDGIGGALIHGVGDLVAAQWKGRDVWGIRKPEPHYRADRAYEQASRAGR